MSTTRTRPGLDRTTTALDAILAALGPRDAAVVRDEDRWVVAVEPESIEQTSGAEALEALDAIRQGWWAGCCTYDLGRAVEHVPDLAADDLDLPDVRFARFEARIVLEPGAEARIEGDGPARKRLERVLADARDHAAEPPEPPGLSAWTTSLDRAGFLDRVETILEHIRAGDCYQVNLTRRLRCERPADPVALFRALLHGNPAPHAALVRIGDTAVVSASPERFLRRDGDRVSTRPIKGTGTDPEALRRSVKDRAENVMIVDLARNDLGRVCAYGSVAVPELCAPEAHPGLHHLVSTVSGTLRPGVGNGALLAATFPPASVTGCPKPRVLEIIEHLEPVRRGVYTGAVGFLDADRKTLDLNVAIRTFTVTGGRTFFGVGGGIVADSDPGAEWEETELKARRLLAVAGSGA